MDPVSQGVLGAAAAQSGARRAHLLAATLCGTLAGMAPDLDALIRSPHDPLLYLEYHRQFSHALVFIPIGALVCAALLAVPLRRVLPFRAVYLYCLLGYATHGLLDACTSYGTQLLWPFSDARIAWHTVSIIDPLFTLPLLLLVVLAARRRQQRYARLALVWVVAFMALGTVQRERAEAAGAALAASRGHAPVRLVAKPSFGNLLVWKLIYEHDGRYHVDALRVARRVGVLGGDSVPRLEPARDLPWLEPGSRQARDLERFRWFSDGYLALDPGREDFVIDMRYSLLPDAIDALWGIRLDRTTPQRHVRFEWTREVTPAARRRLLDMLRGALPARPVVP